MDRCRDGVLAGNQYQASDDSGTDRFTHEAYAESDVASADCDVRRVVKMSIDVDLEIVRVSMVHVEIGNGGWLRIQTLKTQKIGVDAERNVCQRQITDGSSSDGCCSLVRL